MGLVARRSFGVGADMSLNLNPPVARLRIQLSPGIGCTITTRVLAGSRLKSSPKHFNSLKPSKLQLAAGALLPSILERLKPSGPKAPVT